MAVFCALAELIRLPKSGISGVYDEPIAPEGVEAPELAARIGFNLYEYFNNEDALEKALQCWNFIKKHLIDSKNGEWFWSLKADGTINTIDDKAGFWKCPYHNGRMCMELLGRFQ